MHLCFYFYKPFLSLGISTSNAPCWLSHAIGIITGTPLLLGPATSGLGIFLIFLIFLISSFLLQARKTRKEIAWFTVCIGGLFFVWIHLPCYPWICFFYIKKRNGKPPPAALSILSDSYLWLPPPLSVQRNTQQMQYLGMVSHKKILKNGAVWAVVLLFLSVTLLTIFVNSGASPVEHRKVLFYGEHMLGTWDIPEYGKYGKDAVGMFGLWPVYLTTLGYETEILVENRTTVPRYDTAAEPEHHPISESHRVHAPSLNHKKSPNNSLMIPIFLWSPT